MCEGWVLSVPADPIQMMATSGGKRVTEQLVTFPKSGTNGKGELSCRFLLEGWRDLGHAFPARVESLKPHEKLLLVPESNGSGHGQALEIRSEDDILLGWTPRYLAEEFALAIRNSPDKFNARVVRVNPLAPLSRRVLIELNAQLDDHEPMSGDDFRVLSKA